MDALDEELEDADPATVPTDDAEDNIITDLFPHVGQFY